ncbi:hypothetical protein BGK38_06585 [Corynebacterium diphtheriae]|nr:ImmA/IrrE family metallo-endopeptidase [Corynebacterium diphtheriae]ODS22223.1 hypothetical protein BGK38_06585 [Corynebacterium diphtheriae]OLN19774.1 hypothetical protein BUE67_07120 [Corynebacterium diphtheriae]OMO43797.1 hypothetical protein BVL41_07760 [Corynebacterium diphtheriae]ONF68513.1 hypothetical protein BXA19_07380 [Corynebacterium diphtheriae]CAB0492490.1 ImmA/IrrE family metallo-endopeptidase [Corynebacterium diphtheriae]
MLLYQSARQWAQKVGNDVIIEPRGTRGLETIAARLGASVIFQPMNRDYSGIIIQENGQSPEIFINELEHPMRQRFTLAHELGHLVERMFVADDPEYSFVDTRITKPGQYDLHEFFADEFAGELLMPADKFLSVYNGKGEFAASAEFGVSVPAVRRRIQRLEKNPPE